MDNITDLKKAQKKKREKTGWTPEEVEQMAAKEMQEYKKKAENEPDQLTSGDMQKIIDGDDDDEENK